MQHNQVAELSLHGAQHGAQHATAQIQPSTSTAVASVPGLVDSRPPAPLIPGIVSAVVPPAVAPSAAVSSVPGLVDSRRVTGLIAQSSAQAQTCADAQQADESMHGPESDSFDVAQHNAKLLADQDQENNPYKQRQVSEEDKAYLLDCKRPPGMPMHTGFIHPEKTAYLATKYNLTELHFEMFDLMLHLTPTHEFLDWVEVLLREVRVACLSSSCQHSMCFA